jgi:HlyD family secretion protein
MKDKRRIAIPIVVAAALGSVLWFAVLRDGGGGDAVIASGTVEATEARLGFQAPGRIERVGVREGDAVTQGAELSWLDRAEALARREQAAARAEAARAALDELERGSRPEEIAQARAQRDAARQRLDDAERDVQRTTLLFEGGAVSREALDKALVAKDVAAAQIEQAEEQLNLVEAGPRRERVAAQRALVAEARAAVDVLDASLRNLTVVAPFDGVITVRHHEPGETVPAGAPVLTLMNPDDRWVRIYVREDRIGAVKLGAAATIVSDTYPEKTYRGEVMFIASEAEFTPKNVQTTEERVKLVYAVKVRVTGDPDRDLKPGMPADVRLELEAP